MARQTRGRHSSNAQTSDVSRLQSDLIARTLSLSVRAEQFQDFLGEVLATIAEVVGERNGAVWLYDETVAEARLYLQYDGTTIVPGVGSGQPPPRVRAPTLPERKWWLEPHGYEDVENAPDLAPYLDALRARNVKSVMIVPLRVGDRMIGALAVQSSRRRKYRQQDLRKAAAVAYPAALVIELLFLVSKGRREALLADREQFVTEAREAVANRTNGRPGSAPRPRGPNPRLDTSLLTQRERDVLALMMDGETNRRVAATLGIAEGTVKVHTRRVLSKLGARSRSEAVSIALRGRVR